MKLGLLVASMVTLVAVLQYRLWVSDDGLPAIKRLSDKIDAQTEENARLKSRNERLEAEVRDLKAGLEAIEERARRELGMIGEGETFYQFVQPPPAAESSPAQSPAPAAAHFGDTSTPTAPAEDSAVVESR